MLINSVFSNHSSFNNLFFFLFTDFEFHPIFHHFALTMTLYVTYYFVHDYVHLYKVFTVHMLIVPAAVHVQWILYMYI